MTKRLIKIATELNVGTTTIVEYLNDIGYEIENKPTAKITDEMYEELLKEFQKSIAIKEQADSMVIGGGSRPVSVKKETVPVSETIKEPLHKKEELVSKTTVDPHAEEPAREERPSLQSRLKVVGKIDLESRLKSKSTERDKGKTGLPKAEPVQETPEQQPAVEQPVMETTQPAQKAEPAEVKEVLKNQAAIEKSSAPAPEDSEKTVSPEKEKQPEAKPELKEKEPPIKEAGEEPALIRAETPELRGLKILGKIDTDKFERPKKNKKKPEPDRGRPQQQAQSPKEPPRKEQRPGEGASEDQKKQKKPAPVEGTGAPKPQTSDDADRKKRKRKRRKVTAPSPGRDGDGAQGKKAPDKRPEQREEIKEVSQKEIEDKIKATMARLSGTGKKKGQKLRREKRERIREKQDLLEQEQLSEKLQVTEFISVQELANLMDVPAADVIMTCLNLGVIVSINQRLDAEIIELVAEEFGHEVEFISAEDHTTEEEEIEDLPEDLQPRAPIVTVMGHVDHGKTSLLDYIREANVVSGEAGGITQHIGAYEVSLEDGRKVTFLDTPGHEAFTAMRARGAKVTDIAVIIIAADDSIMPQTREAISHAQAAGVPIVFAINKIDKPNADPEKIKGDLAAMNFLVESWGGKYQSQDISAKTGTGIDELLEKILLEAELLELTANPDRPAIGTVLEASLDKGRGYVAKFLIQTGTLQIGDAVVAGEHAGKIKAMFNERNKRIHSAGPSSPVLVLGLSGAPQAGERIKVVESEQEARQIAAKRAQISREQANRATKRISLDEIGRRLALGTFKELNLIVKGDVDGSVEALSDSLIKLSQETVQVNVIHKAVGQIIESDVLLASASDAIVIGFQVRPSMAARRLAEREGVQIKTYSIIYEAIEEVKAAIEGMLEPTKEENIVGQAEVREVYKISKVGTVAGCYMQEGKLTRNTNIRIIRNGIVIFPTREGAHGEIASLKRFKEDVREVKTGLECGISVKNFNDIKVGDVIEGYEIIEIKQKLQ